MPSDETRSMRQGRRSALLPAILAVSLVVNLWGNRWGAPQFWHPDELTPRAIRMVDRRSLNPEFFAYGGVQYYVIALGGVLPARAYSRLVDPQAFPSDSAARQTRRDRVQTRIIQAARVTSAIVSVAVVAIVFHVAALLFDEGVAALASGLLAVAMPWVLLAHLATVDAGATFWYWLACLAALLYWRRGRSTWLYLGGLLAGVAIGAKLDRFPVLVPLFVSYLLRGDRDQRRPLGLAFLGLVPLGYLAANPTIVIAPFAYLDGVTREFFFNLSRPRRGFAPLTMLRIARSGLGLPLFVAVAVGTIYATVRLLRERKFGVLLWVVSTFVPTALLYAPGTVRAWYVPFFFPPLMILAAYGGVSVFRSARNPARYLAVGVMALVMGAAAARTVAVVRLFQRETRDRAAEWLVANVPAGATITIVGTGPALPLGRFKVRTERDLKTCAEEGQASTQLSANRRLDAIFQAIPRVEAFARRHLGGTDHREPYKAWFDYALQECQDAHAGVSQPPDAQRVPGSYFLVVDNGVSRSYNPRLPHHVAAEFPRPAGFDHDAIVFLAPTVTIVDGSP